MKMYGFTTPPPDVVFDYSLCFKNLIKNYPGQKAQDLLMIWLDFFYRINHSPNEILNKLFPEKMIKHGYNIYKGGNWQKKDFSYGGNNLLSLVKAIKVPQIKKTNYDFKIFLEVAEYCNIDFTKKNIKQIHGKEHFLFYESYKEKIFFPEYISFLGNFKNKYCFYNEYDDLSFLLFEWIFNNNSLKLFETTQINKKTGDLETHFIAPPYKKIIYNKEQIEKSSNIYIFDNIDYASEYNNKNAIKEYNVFKPKQLEEYPPQMWFSTWSGDISIASDIDWSFLKKKNVVFCFDANKFDSIKIGSILINAFYKFGTKLGLCSINDYHGKPFLNRIITDEEFCKIAKENYDINLSPTDNTNTSIFSDFKDFDNEDEPVFMVKPYFEKGEIILLTANQKTGKSLFSLDLSLMVSCGESMGNRLSAEKAYKTLFIDGEMNERNIIRRIRGLKSNYKRQNMIEENFKLICMQKHKKRLDLSLEEDQKWLEGLIEENVKFIVLDNLGRLLSHKAEKSEVSWEKFSSWLKKLTRKGISILIVHHENKEGNHRGTGKITDDVDVWSSLKKPDKCLIGRTIMGFHIEDARNLYGDQLKPFSIEYINEDNRIIREINTSCDYNNSQYLVSEEEITEHNLSELEVQMLTDVRSGKEIQARDYKKEDRDNSTTISKSFRKLSGLRLLISNERKTKGVKYKVHPI